MVLTHTEIEIDAPPERVREVFMDWKKYPEWEPRFMKSVEPAEQKSTIEAGDKLNVQLTGMAFTATVLENTEQGFVWRGSLPFIFTGDHAFRWEPSKTNPGGTTFVNEENFSGLMSFLMLPMFGYGPNKNFESFNEDLKKKVESMK